MDQGTLYIAGWSEHKIRVLAAGQVTTLAGKGAGHVDGPANVALFNFPADVAVHQGSIYVADSKNHRVRVISPVAGSGSDAGVGVKWEVKTIAGDGVPGFKDGPAASARFNDLRGIAVSSAGLIYVADKANHRIRIIRP